MPSSWTRIADREVRWDPPDPAAGARAKRADALYLVTQVGRAFQDEHPWVRPVLDHGRHLVVQGLDPSLAAVRHTCWRVEPLPADEVVVGVARRAPDRSDPTTAALLAELAPGSYEADLTHLAGIGTRHSFGPGFTVAADWAAGRLAALGCAVRREPVSVGGARTQNVVGDRAGSGPAPRPTVVVTAHLDSVNTAGGPAAPAPGADDNASGAAGVLELGRVLVAHRWEHDLRLVLFGGEEQGLHGSTQHVASLSTDDRDRIRAVLNMDMIASQNGAVATVLLEGAAVSSTLMADCASAAATYTGLAVETSLNPFASDHVPFIDAGLPALLTIEGTDSANGNVHTALDTTGYLDLELAEQILRMNLAALAGWLGPVGEPAHRIRPAGSVVAPAEGRLDVFSVGGPGAHRVLT